MKESKRGPNWKEARISILLSPPLGLTMSYKSQIRNNYVMTEEAKIRTNMLLHKSSTATSLRFQLVKTSPQGFMTPVRKRAFLSF